MKSPISYCISHDGFRVRAGAFALTALLAAAPAMAQVVTIDTHGNATQGPGSTVDRRFAQIQPTHVELDKNPLDTKTRLELTRLLQAEQGFAMRPFPRGHKGLELEANGKLKPAGEPYLNMVTENGLSAKPGDRVVITDIKFDKNKIMFMLNGGPDAKHRFLRHIQIGAGGDYGTPVVQDDGQEPVGARLTLTFKDHVPAMTDKDLKALLAPLISFDVKTPIQAFTDTLPPKLKDAILNHHVMVGMTTDMVMFALGRPDQKIRTIEDQMPYEEWIYGKPPEPVQFVRINGNRVIRLEIAAVGKTPQIWEKDEVDAMMRTDGTPEAPPANTRTVAMGDVVRDPDTQAPAAPPTLRKEGEALPQDDPRSLSAGAMKPVQFPKQQADDYPDASKLPRTQAADDKTADNAADKTTENAAGKTPGKAADMDKGTPA
ncbi:MAG TPA: hypothetical protein VFE01_00300, partial [Terracidiphilus sp.]|nr:hypothetical protein [Terracidiphilus sp.]